VTALQPVVCLLKNFELQLSRRKSPNQMALFRAEAASAFWQGRYYDFNVLRERRQVEKLRCRDHNPVKRGLVRSPELWR
jgi:hypothetical protein